MTGPATPIAERLAGVPFLKMTGSGNDFVVFERRHLPVDLGTVPQLIAAICHRGNGIGADGVVVVEPFGDGAPMGVRYFNRDGTEGALCGNATLCSAALAVALGAGDAAGMVLATGDGPVSARLAGGTPEIRLAPVRMLRPDVPGVAEPGERGGYAVVGVPHLVLTTPAIELVAVGSVGPGLRRHAAVGAAGANVNWVQRLGDGRWRYRTFERGVEGETLACGTGAVAVAALLQAWGMLDEASGDAAGGSGVATSVALVTSSGRTVTVTLPTAAEAAAGIGAALAGEGRVVFRGVVASLW